MAEKEEEICFTNHVFTAETLAFACSSGFRWLLLIGLMSLMSLMAIKLKWIVPAYGIQALQSYSTGDFFVLYTLGCAGFHSKPDSLGCALSASVTSGWRSFSTHDTDSYAASGSCLFSSFANRPFFSHLAATLKTTFTLDRGILSGS